MTVRALFSLVRENISRSKKNFMMSGIGIVVGVATFAFFMGLSGGIKNVVMHRIFLVTQVEVVPRVSDIGPTQMSTSRTIDQSVTEELAAIDGVKAVYPKMKFTFPTRGYGGKRLFGRQVWAEIIADGIEPELVASDLGEAAPNFRDWEVDLPCQNKGDCPPGSECEPGSQGKAGLCKQHTCVPNGDNPSAPCEGVSYCVEDRKRCEMPIPVVVSNHILELYNGSLATAIGGGAGGHKIPRLSKEAVTGFQLNLTLGKSFLDRVKGVDPLTRRAQVIGFSDKAITIGVTMPIQYVRRYNRRFSGAEQAATYHSVILEAERQSDVPRIMRAVEKMGYDFADKTQLAEKVGSLIQMITVIFGLISAIIVGIAAINISHTFFMIIFQRRREIGVLRAIGASRGDVRVLILAEAASIGLVGGALGISVAILAAKTCDHLIVYGLNLSIGGWKILAFQPPQFPFKPDTFFAFPGWLWPTAVGFAVLFCLLGALFPAGAAARLEPAEALTN